MKKFFKKFIRNITIVIALVVLVVTAIYAMRIQIIKAIVELKGSAANGAVVEIEGLQNPLFTLDVTWDRLQVADKNDYMKNAYEINNANFKMVPRPLLAGKFLIEELNVGEVLLGTDRAESGELPDELKPKETEVEQVKEEKEESAFSREVKDYFGGIVDEKTEEALAFDDFDDQNFTENLEKEFDIKLQEEFEAAEEKVEEKEEYWNNLVTKRAYDDRIKQLETDVNDIDLDTSNLVSLFHDIKDVESFKNFEKELKRLEEKKDEIEDVVDDGRDIVDDIDKDKKNFDKDISELTAIKNDLAKSVEDDLNNIKAVGDMNREQLEALTQRLLGGKASTLIFKLTDTYNKITGIFGEKKELSAEELEKAKNESMPELPRLWIKKTTVKVFQNSAEFDGVITDITDNQNRTGNPIVISLTNIADKKLTTLDSIIDFRGDANLKKVEINQDGIVLRDESLGFAKMKKSDAVAESHVTMDHGVFSLMLNVEIFNIEFAKPGDTGDEITQKVVEGVVADIDTLTLNMGYEDNKFILKSNLTDLFSDKLDDVYKEELKKAEEKVKKEVNLKIEAYRASLLADVNDLEKRTGDLLSEDQRKAVESFKGISEVEDKFNEELDKLDNEKDKKLKNAEEQARKELEAKIKAEEARIQAEKEKAQKELEAKIKAEEEKVRLELEKKKAEEEAKIKAEEEKKQKELEKKLEEEAKKLFKF